MRHSILGRKLGMSQIFDQQGNAIPVTIIQAGPCRVLQVKSLATDGYNAIQIGFIDKKEKHTTGPLKGHFRKAGSVPQRYIREVRVEDPGLFSVGQAITCGLFLRGDFIDITGTSKGKGYAGVMKRHGFGGFGMTHGTHESNRGPGSIGQASDPSRTFRGLRMAGQMGGDTVTVQNLVVIDNHESENLLFVKGPVPGGKNGIVVIRHSIKKAAPPDRKPEAEPAPSPETEPEVPETEPEVIAAPADAGADEQASNEEPAAVEEQASEGEQTPIEGEKN